MPYPKKGESRSAYLKRAIPMIMAEGKDQKAAVGKAELMYNTYSGKGDPYRDESMKPGERIEAWRKGRKKHG